jgi:ankyrin repeat protein
MNKSGMETFLYQCTMNKHVSLVEMKSSLTKENVNAQNYHGQTALMLGIMNRQTELCKATLSVDGIDIHKKTFVGEKNAVMYSCEFGNDEILILLLQKEADLIDVDAEGRNALYYIIKNKHFGNLRRVLADKKVKKFIDQQDKNGKTAIHHALGHHFYPEMRSLIIELVGKEADVNIKDNRGRKPHEYYSKKDMESLFQEIDYQKRIN